MSYRQCLAVTAATVALAVSCIALSAKPEPTSGDESAARLNAALSKLKAGLWQFDMTMEDTKSPELSDKPMIMRMCTDQTGAASASVTRRRPNPNHKCKIFATPIASGGTRQNLECVDDGGVWGSSSEMTSVSENGATLVQTIFAKDGTKLSSKTVMRWLGACPADMKPGQVDMKLPDLPPRPAG